MKKLAILLVAAVAAAASAQSPRNDVGAWEKTARGITIVRDDWGIAHVHGKTDADAVFGMIYAQAEDDFNRVETNFLNSQGRLAEAEGEAEVWRDLRMKLFINPDTMKAQYAKAPQWLKSLMNSWADGLNYYLYKHPEVKPRVITRFEPWMALTFSEGSIGGDIEKVNLTQLEAFYGKGPVKISRAGTSGARDVGPAALALSEREVRAALLAGIGEDGSTVEPAGSNGAAVAPKNTVNHRALLLINPHTSFFFRSELQMTSDEGLNAYGAVTWGQFFIYQGFNATAGWMHTSSGVDATDEYLETVTQKGDKFFYKYGSEERPFITASITVPYRNGATMAEKKFTAYYTPFGPVVRALDGKWVAFRIMQEPLKALTQSYSRIKARDYKAFKQTMDLHTNSSNNTIFADASGNIAYFHGNFIPKRDTKFDWARPVDGSDPATEWRGLLSVDESPNLLNPESGWLYNTNNWPWSAAGASSPKKENFPPYVENGGESARGLHAIRVLENRKDFTPAGFRDAAYDSYLTFFEKPIPALLKAWDDMPASNPLKQKVSEQIAMLRKWDLRWSASSVPTSLAVFWGEESGRLGGGGRGGRRGGAPAEPMGEQLVQALATASDKLAADFGTWKTPWGDINRFQRLTGDIVQPFNDAGASIPVAFPSSRWGSLASFGARAYTGTKKWYGTSGNSFVSVVEFGDSVRAIAVTAGGESGDPKSKHFNDEAERYATGGLRPVYFYPSQLKEHTEREYHPGS